MTSRRKKTRPLPKTGCCPVEVRAFETPLSRCLLTDPYPPSGATHDVDPFGVYQTQTDGTVVFKQALRASPGYVPCKTPNDLDALLVKVFVAAAKHGRRYMVVTEEYAPSFGSRLGEARVFSGSPLQKSGDHTVVRALPEGMILFVEKGNPEDLGRLCYHCGTYGVSLMSPHMVSAVLVVPKPFGFGVSGVEVLA